MPVKILEVSDFGTCCYIVAADEPKSENMPCVVIDPGAEPGRITAEVKNMGLRVESVFLTHAHMDHIGGVAGIMHDWPDAVLTASAETSRRASEAKLNLSISFGVPIQCPPAGRILKDGETFIAANLEWRAVEVPGHEPGEMVYILGDNSMAFVGDTVFAGSVGRSDFPGGDHNALISGVKKLLESLPPDCILFPGHGPATRAGIELQRNPFLTGRMW